MPEGHKKIGEMDRDITGAEWTVTALNMRTEKLFTVGRMLFQGDGRGLERLASFDEMIGCSGCNDIYHKDTRIGPFIKDGGKIRTPTKVVGSSNTGGSTCKEFGISGSKDDLSITLEYGPGAKHTFSTFRKTIWDKDTK